MELDEEYTDTPHSIMGLLPCNNSKHASKHAARTAGVSWS